MIADYILKKYETKVSRSAVSVALSRAGLTKEAMRYREELPWRVKSEHLTQYQARMLRLLGRRRQGGELTEIQDSRLDSWLEDMEDNGWVVGYCPDGPGFIYVIADEKGDGKNAIPIRARTIGAEELPSSS